MCHFFIVETDFPPLFWAQLHCCLIQETVSSMWASHLTMYLQEMNRTPTAGTLQHIPKILSSTLQLYHSDKTGSRVYVICSRSHTQDHCSISLLLSHSHFSFLFLFVLCWVPPHHLSFSLPTPLEFSHLSPPCCILYPSLPLSPPPHMSVCSKLEQRLNRGSRTWREFLSNPSSAVQTQTHIHTQKHTHSAWQPINSLQSRAKGITACWWAGGRVRLCVHVCLWWAGGRQSHLHR